MWAIFGFLIRSEQDGTQNCLTIFKEINWTSKPIKETNSVNFGKKNMKDNPLTI